MGNMLVITQQVGVLQDIYTLALEYYAPSGIMYIYQADPSLLCYNIYLFKVTILFQVKCYICRKGKRYG